MTGIRLVRISWYGAGDIPSVSYRRPATGLSTSTHTHTPCPCVEGKHAVCLAGDSVDRKARRVYGVPRTHAAAPCRRRLYSRPPSAPPPGTERNRCMVFVERRATARVLSEYLSHSLAGRFTTG